MAELTPQNVAAAVMEALDERRAMDPDIHAAQHAFIQMLMDERAERIARTKRMKERIAGSVILTAILGLIGWLGVAAIESLRAITK